MQFDLIAAVDAKWGIGINGTIPWKGTCEGDEDMGWFRIMTRGSVLIMGRKTHESIGKALPGRVNIVISRSYVGVTIFGALTDTPVVYVSSFEAALTVATNHICPTSQPRLQKNIMVIGGSQLYAEALAHPMLRKGYITFIGGPQRDFKCDVFFPHAELTGVPCVRDSSFMGNRIHNRYMVYDFTNPSEVNYLFLLARLRHLPVRPDRTGTGTRAVFHEVLKFELTDGRGMVLPLLTTKRVALQSVIYELLWFLRGDTDCSYLKEHGVTIWDGNTSKEFLRGRGLGNYVEGELGPGYGYQWRHCGAGFTCEAERRYVTENTGLGALSCEVIKTVLFRHYGTEIMPNANMNGAGIDQIANVINSLRADPYSRRHVVSAWNVSQLDQMALVPCHYSFQFVVEPVDYENCDGPKKLNCLVNMRSADMFLGVPFNICSYALLTHMVAKLTGMTAGTLSLSMADCHLYANHTEAAGIQIARTPRRFPVLKFSEKAASCTTIDDFLDCTAADFIVEGYKPHPRIQAKMAL